MQELSRPLCLPFFYQKISGKTLYLHNLLKTKHRIGAFLQKLPEEWMELINGTPVRISET